MDSGFNTLVEKLVYELPDYKIKIPGQKIDKI